LYLKQTTVVDFKLYQRRLWQKKKKDEEDAAAAKAHDELENHGGVAMQD
jgi:hypothetical protein